MLLQIFLSLFSLCLVSIATHKLRQWRCHLPPSPLPLPLIGHFHLLGPLIHHSFRDLSSRYGPLMHLKLGSVSCVVVNTPELAKELLKNNDLAVAARKHSFAIDELTYSSSFAFAPYGPYWKFIKKVSTFELLGNRMLHHFLLLRAKELHRLLQLVDSNAKLGRSVNLTEELIKLSNNIISLMMFGRRSSGTDPQAEVARTLVREVTKLFGEFNVSDFIWVFKNIDIQGFRKKTRDLQKRYDDFLEEIISNREKVRQQEEGKSKEDGNNFLDIMLNYMEDKAQEVQLTRKHIKALVLDFMTAATDTTAISVEWAMAELVTHPEVFAMARKEIETVVGRKRVVEEGDCVNLPFLQAIVKETFRLHPPIPMIIRKSSQDCSVSGYKIPAETLLFVNIWSMGRNSELWNEPLEFRPERFMNNEENVDVKGQHFQLMPFGSGRRSCPGISLAMREVPVTLAALIQCFDWTVADCSVDMGERPGLTAPRASDLKLRPVSRFVLQ